MLYHLAKWALTLKETVGSFNLLSYPTFPAIPEALTAHGRSSFAFGRYPAHEPMVERH